MAMLIAEEMDLPVDKVHVTLADARPESVFNQLTGGSNTMNSMYYPVRTAAAIAKGRLLEAAAIELGQPVSILKSKQGVITDLTGQSVSYGALATKAASPQTQRVSVQLKPPSQFSVIGKPQKRIDALDIVTGLKQFTLDLAVPDAKPIRTVLDKAAQAGGWGRALPKGMGQGIALHREYKQTMACMVEIDCRPQTVQRKVRDAVTGPRVTRGVYVTIPGQVAINPLGMEAQLQGGFMDAIATALTSSLHLKDGYFLEGSWDNYFYTRQWNTPQDLQIIILDSDPAEEVPGSGEAAVAASMAAIASAYAAATGTMPSTFPINHNGPLAFDPYPQERPSLAAGCDVER